LNGPRDDFHVRTEVPIATVPVEIWLHITDPADISRLIVQNWLAPLRSPQRVKALWIVRQRIEFRA
jgi:hypothetical protein